MGRDWLESTTEWVVTLWSGEVLSIFADSYQHDGDDLAFDVLIPGAPPYLVELARVPHALIESLVSEDAGRPDAPFAIESRDWPAYDFGDQAELDAWAEARVPVEEAVEGAAEFAVLLRTGGVMTIYSDVTTSDGSDRVFWVSVAGNPPYDLEVARVPIEAVHEVTVEDMTRPGAPERYVPLPRMPFADTLPPPSPPDGYEERR